MERITIEYDKKDGFTIRQDDRYADCMTWDEMMGLLTELTFPKDFSRVKSWMLTEEQHRNTQTWRYREEEEKPKEMLLLENERMKIEIPEEEYIDLLKCKKSVNYYMGEYMRKCPDCGCYGRVEYVCPFCTPED